MAECRSFIYCFPLLVYTMTAKNIIHQRYIFFFPKNETIFQPPPPTHTKRITKGWIYDSPYFLLLKFFPTLTLSKYKNKSRLKKIITNFFASLEYWISTTPLTIITLVIPFYYKRHLAKKTHEVNDNSWKTFFRSNTQVSTKFKDTWRWCSRQKSIHHN